VLSCEKNFLVTGGEDGFMRVYDFQFRLVAWFEDIGYGPLSSISFYEETLSKDDENYTINMSRCLVSTKRGVVVSIDPKIFDSPLGRVICLSSYLTMLGSRGRCNFRATR
jgi:hypothetical protein